jgi:glutamate synthase (ferredoxin)
VAQVQMGELEMVILFDIPHDFFLKKYVILKSNSKTICRGNAKSPNQVVFCKTTFEASIKDQKLEILGWRQFQLTHQI